MTRLKPAIATLLVLPLLAFAARAEETQKPEEKPDAAKQGEAAAEKPRGNDCVYSRLVSDFEVIDNRTVVVYAPTRKSPYIVELFAPEPGLKFEHTLGFEDRNGDGRICAYGGDAIIVDGPISNRTVITKISRSDADAVKQLRVEASEKKTQTKTTMPAQEDMKSDKAGAQPAPKPSEEHTQPPPGPKG